MAQPGTPKRPVKRGENASVVLEAVRSLVGANSSRTFTPEDVVKAAARLGYLLRPYTAECHIIAGSPNHKQTARYTGYRNKYWWVRGSGPLAEFRLLESSPSDLDSRQP
jgi:hypothetical protein